MKMYWHTAMVHGSGRFPTDMLRYDRCFPSESTSAIRMLDDEPRDIRLAAIRGKDQGWTVQRWRSFNWSLTQEKIEEWYR